MPTEEDKKILEKRGWTLECESPFEMRHKDGSFATGMAARIVMEHLRDVEPNTCGECGCLNDATNTEGTFCQEHEHLVY